ncbi:MAG: hypothetical protein J7L03_01095 [Caldisericaceae bacterium]|nr:hypothetical protein [Caldisericaceae bacterium]
MKHLGIVLNAVGIILMGIAFYLYHNVSSLIVSKGLTGKALTLAHGYMRNYIFLGVIGALVFILSFFFIFNITKKRKDEEESLF